MTEAAQSIITPELRSWIGRKSPLALLEIMTASDVRRYVDATGDANALWLDDEFARGAGYRGRLLPPTLVGWVPFSFREALRNPVPIPPICAGNCRCPRPIQTCAMRDLKSSGCNPFIWENSFQPRAASWTSARARGARGLGFMSRRKNRFGTRTKKLLCAGAIPSPFFPRRNFPARKESRDRWHASSRYLA